MGSCVCGEVAGGIWNSLIEQIYDAMLLEDAMVQREHLGDELFSGIVKKNCLHLFWVKGRIDEIDNPTFYISMECTFN